MSTNIGNPEEDAEVPESVLIIHFAAPSSTLMNVQWKNVMPGQMIVAADYLLQRGRYYQEMQEKKQQEEANKIAKPESKLIVPK